MRHLNLYTVGWICAVHTEYVAAQAFLDERYEEHEGLSTHDRNNYTLGRIGRHNVAIAVLPYGENGLASAAAVARDMLHTFPNIRIGLMVGIGSGAPSPKHDIRLGDVVVGVSSNGSGSVFQYDHGETLQEQDPGLRTLTSLNKSPQVLLSAVNGLMAQYEYEGNQLAKAVSSILDGKPRLRRKYGRPEAASDRLYKSHFVHPLGNAEGCATVCGDDPLNLINRIERTDDDEDPAVHYGLIASANRHMEDALVRDRFIAEKDVLCFEMEAAGLMNHFPCLVIRGICDYADSHRNDQWQGYAAMTATAYAKALLCRIPPNKLEAEITIKESLSDLVGISAQHLAAAKENVQLQKDFAKERLTESEQMCHQLFRLTASDKDATYEWYKDLVEERVEGTCMWLLHHKYFQKWLHQESGPLVITADPGCGKSVLAKYLIDHGLPRSVTICYFFFKDQDQNTIRQALCALLHQLFTRKPVLIKHAMAKFRMDGKGLINSTESLWEVLRNAVNDIQAGPIIIVLDALDECLASEFENLIKHIEIQFSETCLVQGKLKYLLTCRPYDQIVSRFQYLRDHFPNIHIPGEEESDTISQELNYVITYRAKQLSIKNNLPSKIKNYLEFRLGNTPNRTYLWVFLIFDYLNKEIFKKTMKEVESIITTLPKSIDAAYEQILNKSKDHPVVRKALSIILVASRPLTLSEMNVAVSMDDTIHNFNDLDLEQAQSFESRLRTWCGLFITIYHGKIYFLHQTARDFLLADWASPRSITPGLRWKHSITTHEAQSVLADVCVQYLDLFNSPDISGERDQECDKHAFLEYSARNWSMHLHESHIMDNSGILSSVLRICDADSRSYSTWFDLFWQTTGQQPTRHFTDLMIACYCGHTTVTQLCLESGANIEARDTIYNRTPLLWAATEGRDDVVKLMVEKGADIDANEHGRTSLLWASKQGHEATVKLLLEAGADTGVKDDSYGQTPLLWATKQGNEAVVKLLLDKKAEIETKDAIFGQTPLMWAAEKGHDTIVKLLLKSGANIEAKENIHSRTAVFLAISNGHDATLQLLLQSGANIELQNKNGWVPLAWAAARRHPSTVKLLLERVADTKTEKEIVQTALSEFIKRGDEYVISLLIDEGADVNGRDANGQTPLLLAIHWGKESIVEKLLLAGADANGDANGQTPLILAIRLGKPIITVFLLAAGADMDKDDNGLTPLTLAIKMRYTALAIFLIEQGAHTNRRDASGQTPLVLAIRRGKGSIVLKLLSSGADVNEDDKFGRTPLMWTIIRPWPWVFHELLGQGADLNKCDKKGRTPLIWAVKSGDENIVGRLLEWGADLNKCDKGGQTPLIWAVKRGYGGITERLLNWGADLNKCDKKGKTPLVWAMVWNDIKIVKLLLSEGADVERDDRDGQTLLIWAIRLVDPLMVKLLLNKGADVERSDKDGQTPIMWAVKMGNGLVLKLLLRRIAAKV